MAHRAVFHVVPYANGWTINQEGHDDDKGEMGAWDHKDLAVEKAKELAQTAERGQVIVHGQDGRIQEEFTYGDDPSDVSG